MLAVLLSATASAAPLGAPGLAEVNARLGGLSVPFEANQGQLSPSVAYAAQTFYGATFVTRDGELVHALAGPRNVAPIRVEDRFSPPEASPAGSGWSLVERFLGGVNPEPRGEALSSTRVSRFVGADPSGWRSDIVTYRGVTLGHPWPGIRVDVRAHGGNVEKIFTVAPGADPGRIEVGVEGALSLRLDGVGDLVAETGNGPVHFAAPKAYQMVGGERQTVAVRYALVGDDAYTFSVGDHDAGLPLTIDPLLQSTYLGGTGRDQVGKVAIDGSGNVIVVGRTESTDFPGTAGGAQPSHGSDMGGFDVFVGSLTADLGTLEQATYLGGSGGDFDSGLTIDDGGNVIVVGFTASTDFPGTTGGAQATTAGGQDGFVASLTADLATLNQATYLGGSSGDLGLAVAIDGSGNVIVVGGTESTDFPGTMGGAQPSHASDMSGNDAFVASLTADLTTLNQATYLGGNGYDAGNRVAIDGSGHVIVSGFTGSTDLPGTAGSAQPALAGGQDAFLASVTADLTTLHQATYLGGGGDDDVVGMAIDLAGDVIVTGFTYSTDFPGTAGGAQPSASGPYDSFAANVSPDLTTLNQSTYLGGSGGEFGWAVAIDGSGNVIVAGLTNSTDFPGTTGGAQPANAGGDDAFVVSLTPDLGTLQQATYLGGVGEDQSRAVAIDLSGNVIVAGLTNSTDFPGRTGGAQPTFGGGPFDGFVARLTPDLLLVSPVSPVIEVPALGGFGLLALAGLLALTGALLMRRVSG